MVRSQKSGLVSQNVKSTVDSQRSASRNALWLLFLLLTSNCQLLTASAQSQPYRIANLSNIRFADGFVGADWAAKINAADADIGSGAGTILVPSSLAGTASTALSLSAKRQVIFDAGTFTSSVAQAISNANIRLSGAGPAVSVFVFSGATNGFNITPSVADAQINLNDFSLLTSNASAGRALNISPSVIASDINLRNIYIGQTGSGQWSYGIWGSQYESSVLSSISTRNVSVGLHLENNSNADTVINPIIGGGYATGIELNNANDCWLIGGTIQGSPTTALIDLQANSGLSTAGTHLESAASTRTYGVKVAGYYASFSGIEMTNNGYTSGFYVTNPGQFSLSNSWVSANASVALVNIVGTSGSTGNPATLTGNFLHNTGSGAGVMVDGTIATKISGGTIHSNSDCLLLGSVHTTLSVLVEGVHLWPAGSSGYAVNPVSLSDTGSLTLIGNRFGVSIASGRIISGGPYRALGNTAQASHWPDTIMTDAGDPLVVQTAHNYAGTLQEWRQYGGSVGASVDYQGHVTAAAFAGRGRLVSQLPSASSSAGIIVVVTDSTAVSTEGQTCVGGSSTTALALSNGSVWKCF